MTSVLIYDDYIHNNASLYRALCRHFGTDEVGFCDAADIIKDKCLDSSIKLFVMPGGADLYYKEKLDGAGNAAIRRYVENGGTYLGICAGAYFACAFVEWARGTDQEIMGPRELAFFEGRGVGPAPQLIQDGDVAKSWHSAADIAYDDGTFTMETKVHYEGGTVFLPYGVEDDGYKTLARYTVLPDSPAAIIECPAGAGKAILCGPHPENVSEDLMRQLYRHANPNHDWNLGVAEELRASETLSRKLWSYLLQRCVRQDQSAQPARFGTQGT